MSFLKILDYIRKAFVIASPFIVLAEATEQPGPEKKQQALSKLKDALAELKIQLPDWLQKYQDWLLGLIIDVVVFIFNKWNFFEPASSSAK